MRVTAECPHCRHQFPVDSGYVGTKRKCPECQEKFLFEQYIDDTPAVAREAAGDDPPGEEEGSAIETVALDPQMRLGCRECLRLYAPNPSFPPDRQPCRFCSAMATAEEGLAFAEVLRAVDPLCLDLLLMGAPRQDVIKGLGQLGIAGEGAETIFARHRRQLPFERYRMARFSPDEKELRSGTECDLCGEPMKEIERTTCTYVHWEASSEDSDTGAMQMGFLLGGILGGLLARWITKDKRRNELDGLYSVCTGCRKSLGRGYGGEATEGGFKRKKLQDFTLRGDVIRVSF